MRGRGPQPRHSHRRSVVAALVGLLMLALILAVLGWVVGTWPRPGWRGPGPAVPTSPGP